MPDESSALKPAALKPAAAKPAAAKTAANPATPSLGLQLVATEPPSQRSQQATKNKNLKTRERPCPMNPLP